MINKNSTKEASRPDNKEQRRAEPSNNVSSNLAIPPINLLKRTNDYTATKESLRNIGNGALGRSYTGIIDKKNKKIELFPLSSAESYAFPNRNPRSSLHDDKKDPHHGRGFVIDENDGPFTIGGLPHPPIVHAIKDTPSHQQLASALQKSGAKGFNHKYTGLGPKYLRGFTLNNIGSNVFTISFHSVSQNKTAHDFPYPKVVEPENDVMAGVLDTLRNKYGMKIIKNS